MLEKPEIVKDDAGKEKAHGLAPVDAAKDVEKVDLGKYGEDLEVLDQDQMLGIGGGTIFYEILDHEGNAIKHLAMPALLRDRSVVSTALKAHAQVMIGIHKTIENEENLSTEDVTKKLEDLEEQDYAALLRTAYYCLRRCDACMKNVETVEEGVEIIKNWIDIKQLKAIPEIAMGLNRFNPLMGAALTTPLH